MKLVVFDLDGTLNCTELYAVPAHKIAMTEFSARVLSDEQIMSVFGARAEDYINILLPGANNERKKQYLKRAFELENQLMKEHGQPYECVIQALDELRAQDYRTSVCSNASIKYITNVLSALHISDKIDYTQPLIPGKTKKDSLKALLGRVSPARAVMVGDTAYDLDATRANGIPFIGCLYGFAPGEIEDADVLVKAPKEIPAAVRRLTC